MSHRVTPKPLQRALTLIWIACTAVWAAILYLTITGRLQ